MWGKRTYGTGPTNPAGGGVWVAGALVFIVPGGGVVPEVPDDVVQLLSFPNVGRHGRPPEPRLKVPVRRFTNPHTEIITKKPMSPYMMN
jgi:hypothetical protein